MDTPGEGAISSVPDGGDAPKEAQSSKLAVDRSSFSATASNARARRHPLRVICCSIRWTDDSSMFSTSRFRRPSPDQTTRLPSPAAILARDAFLATAREGEPFGRPLPIEWRRRIRRWLRSATLLESCRRVARLPPRRAGLSARGSRSPTPWLCSCPRSSPALANRRPPHRGAVRKSFGWHGEETVKRASFAAARARCIIKLYSA